MLEEVLIL